MGSQVEFNNTLSFKPDRFQVEAFEAVELGENVIVAAPTGSGKTLVAEFAVFHTLKTGGRVFYTTPIKALSNQKYRDLVQAHGADNVGIVTGDSSINSDAPVIVMTTEVLRNMIYAQNGLDDLRCVVLDEVHFLQDRFRGAVWEEVIIHLEEAVKLVALSATVSNTDQLQGWFEQVRGETRLVVSTKRPVTLTNRYMATEAGSGRIHLINVAKGNKPNPAGYSFDKQYGRRGGHKKKPNRGRTKRYNHPGYVDVITRLRSQDLLPAIYFLFSRQGCEDAAAVIKKSGMRLTTDAESKEIEKIATTALSGLNQVDAEALNLDDFIDSLKRGVGAHHAGLIPQFKEVVEVCFTKGLLKVVFATETLALGINMPARTVVIDKLTKFTGETHEFLTASQYSQLTGRAGRRGIDTQGTAVVLWSPFVDFAQVADLAMSTEFPLNSSFRPNYNMTANLVKTVDAERARDLLSKSFAQFQVVDQIAENNVRNKRLDQRQKKLKKRSTSGSDVSRSDQLRLKRINKELKKATKVNERLEGSLIAKFDDVCEVLTRRGHMKGWELTSSGELLLEIYHESDLLLIEAISEGLFDGIEGAELVSFLSAFCYEERRRDHEGSDWFPSSVVKQKYLEAEALSREINGVEAACKVELTRGVDAGFVSASYGWASGGTLEEILEYDEFQVGDFCRTLNKISDLAEQLAKVSSNPSTAKNARVAGGLIDRGLVRLSTGGAANGD